ncbi:MAG: hypothetical protein HFG40_04225 [Bacilli bacterium]|nr:hypothetical protein [Bacilli bacterium]
MYGAIIGDLAGSIYEFEQVKAVHPVYMKHILEENAFFSDDTILTIAILDAVLNDQNYDKYLRKYIREYLEYKPDFSPYFTSSFSPSLICWCQNSENGTSIGNGAMMRISPIGYLFHTEVEVVENARLATIPSHNTKEAIDAATCIALMIYYFKMGFTKDEVYQKLSLPVQYFPFQKFNTTCYETLINCLYAFYYSDSFESAIYRTLQMGGDTDTNCAIVGSLAESLYGVEDSLKTQVSKKIPKEFVKILNSVQCEER